MTRSASALTQAAANRSRMAAVSEARSRQRRHLEREALVEPARDAAGHDLDRASELGEAQGAPRRPVAVGAVAVGHENRLPGPRGDPGFDDLAVRETDGAWNMAPGERGGAADVQQDEVGPFFEGVVDVPAVGLEGEFRGEVLAGQRTGRRRNDGDGRGHRGSPFADRYARDSAALAVGVNDIIRKYHADRKSTR